MDLRRARRHPYTAALARDGKQPGFAVVSTLRDIRFRENTTHIGLEGFVKPAKYVLAKLDRVPNRAQIKIRILEEVKIEGYLAGIGERDRLAQGRKSAAWGRACQMVMN